MMGYVSVLFKGVGQSIHLGNGIMEVHDDSVSCLGQESGTGSSRVMDLLYSSSFLVS